MAQSMTLPNPSSRYMTSSKKGFGKFIGLMIITFILLMGMCGMNSLNILQTTGQSMSPTILDESKIVYSHSETLKSQLKRFDIIIFSKDGNLIAKRVIGLPGDHVVIKAGHLYINDVLIKENYLNEDQWGDALLDQFDQIIPDGYLFVLGDNRNYSRDSRHEEIGLISIENEVLGVYLNTIE